MSKKQIFKESLQANKDLLNTLTSKQLEEIMTVFDNYETQQSSITAVVQAKPEYLYCEETEFNNQVKCEHQCIPCKRWEKKKLAI